MTMYHGDDKGLVLPPRVANVQVIIIPIPFKGKEQDVVKAATTLYESLKKTDIRVQIDTRDNYNPGWKFNHWELKGVPIRLELGPKDIDNKEARVVIRYNGEKLQVKWIELEKELPVLLEKIQEGMYERAVARFNDKAKQATTWQ
jgi:prolyl-tRNA synthetase